MENATKALLIAAAVLVAILIISLGLVVYNRAAETANNSGDLSEYQMKQFNEKFTKYEGDAVSGSDVNAMLQTVFNHNNAQGDTTTCVSVFDHGQTALPATGALTGGTEVIDNANNITRSPAKENTGARYDIKCQMSAQTGMVTEVHYRQIP